MDAGDIFGGHLLRSAAFAPQLRQSTELVWPSWLLLAGLLIIVFLKRRSLARVSRIVQSTFSEQLLQQIEREEGNSLRAYAVLLNVLYLVAASFILYKFNSVYKLVLTDSPALLQFGFFTLLVAGVFIAKSVVNTVLMVIGGDQRPLSQYTMSAGLVNQSAGLIVFPLLMLSEFSTYFSQVFLYAAVAIFALAVLVKWFRGLRLGLLQGRIGILQLLSYFCGLEILPVVVLAKYIVEKF